MTLENPKTLNISVDKEHSSRNDALKMVIIKTFRLHMPLKKYDRNSDPFSLKNSHTRAHTHTEFCFQF